MVSPGVRILCAEADENTRQMLSLLLGFAGFDVCFAATVRQAQEFAESESFDLCLVDEQFPDGSGVDLIRQMRVRDKEVPIIMQSAQAYRADVQKGFNAGANVYFSKPVFPDELIKRIKKLTGIWQE